MYRAYGDILDLSHAVHAGGAGGTLRAGLWYEHQDNRREQHLVDWTLGSVFDAAPGTDPHGFNGKNALGQTGTGAYVYHIVERIDTVRPFVEYDWTPAPGVTVIAGVKHISFTRDHRADINQGSKLPIDFKKTWSATLPSISANWRIEPATSVYAQVTRGFIAPNANVFHTASVGKNDVEPQKTINYKADVVHQRGRFSVDFDSCYIDFNNFITTVTDFSVTPNQTYSVNGGGVIYEGIEERASLTLMRSVSAFAAGSINSAETKGGDARAGACGSRARRTTRYRWGYCATTARSTARSWASGSARAIRANGVNLQSVDGQLAPTAAAQIVDPVTARSYTSDRLGAYNTVDLTIGHRLKTSPVGRALKLEFQIQNLLNNCGASDTNGRLLTGGGGAINSAATTYTYLSPRAFSGSVTVAF